MVSDEQHWADRAKRGAQLCELDRECRQLIDGTSGPRACLGAMVAADRMHDAIRFLAYVLPGRHAVWWGCLCAWTAYRTVPLGAPERTALEAALAWVIEPDEATRSAAESAGWALELDNPAAALALASAWCEPTSSAVDAQPAGSMTALGARAVAGSILLSAAAVPSEEPSLLPRQFLEIGAQVAEHPSPWESSPAPNGSVVPDPCAASDAAGVECEPVEC